MALKCTPKAIHESHKELSTFRFYTIYLGFNGMYKVDKNVIPIAEKYEIRIREGAYVSKVIHSHSKMS